MALAIFDLDNTLIAGDSDYAWGEFLVEKGLVDPIDYKKQNDYFYQQYQRGSLDIEEYLTFALAPLASHDSDSLQQWHNEFMQTKIAPMLLDSAKELLLQHRNQGDYLLIITSTNSFITGPICKLLEVDDYIATDPEQIAGSYTGRVAGTPAYREGKIERLNQWLTSNDQSLKGSYGYSDSINDLPLLEAVDYPVVVDGDQLLKDHASARGWPSISLRS